jgi:hypothetical protein
MSVSHRLPMSMGIEFLGGLLIRSLNLLNS